MEQHLLHRAIVYWQVTDKKSQMILLRDYEIEEIVCDNDSCLRSFSVNYGYV